MAFKVGDIVKYLKTGDLYKIAYIGKTFDSPLIDKFKLVYQKTGNVRWCYEKDIVLISSLTLKGSRGTPSYCEDCKATVIPGSICKDGSEHQ